MRVFRMQRDWPGLARLGNCKTNKCRSQQRAEYSRYLTTDAIYRDISPHFVISISPCESDLYAFKHFIFRGWNDLNVLRSDFQLSGPAIAEIVNTKL